MDSETLQMIAIAVITYYELCAIQGSNPVFAYIWDIIATITGILANILGRISVQARLNYYVAVQA